MNSSSVTALRYDPSGVMIRGKGLSPSDLERLAPRLQRARADVLADVESWRSGDKIPPEMQPLDAGFITMPVRLLEEYRETRATSQLQRILSVARKLSDAVDRVVVLGIGGSYLGGRALLEACCHPYYNELSRAERGGHPRMYFEGNNVDNDAIQGLIDLLGDKPTRDVADRWAMVVVSKSGQTLETALAFRALLPVLRGSCGDDPDLLASLVVPVTGQSGRLYEWAQSLGCQDIFPVPAGVGGRYSVLSAVGLMPAAILGLDIIKLLEGATAMNAHFREAPPGKNIVLDYVGVSHAMEQKRGATIRVLATWSKALEGLGMWYDQLLSESLGKQQQGATPLTVVNTRDLHSRGQQHQQGRRDKMITNLIVDAPCGDRLPVGASDFDQDELNALAAKTLPEVTDAAIAAANQAYADDHRPTADLHLPRLDEAALGQFFQMMMLATAVEGRLIGINPYGQPGVETYKKHMHANLNL